MLSFGGETGAGDIGGSKPLTFGAQNGATTTAVRYCLRDERCGKVNEYPYSARDLCSQRLHVTSYLRKSDDFRGNLSRISMKTCAERRHMSEVQFSGLCMYTSSARQLAAYAITSSIRLPSIWLCHRHDNTMGKDTLNIKVM